MGLLIIIIAVTMFLVPSFIIKGFRFCTDIPSTGFGEGEVFLR